MKLNYFQSSVVLRKSSFVRSLQDASWRSHEEKNGDSRRTKTNGKIENKNMLIRFSKNWHEWNSKTLIRAKENF